MKPILLILLLFFFPDARAQKLITGVVLDAEKNSPVAGASVYLNNTSVGTTTGQQGSFALNVPQGKFELIVSSIGYQTYNLPLSLSNLPDTLVIRLRPRAKELENVVVEAYEKEGWEKWGSFFLRNFIGTSAHASGCRILNKEVIRFRRSKKNGELTAYATEPLIIENRSLGYTIRYQLEVFRYEYKTGYLLYQGFPFFEPMKSGAAREKKWAERRDDVYYGSMLHFMRSLYRNRLIEEGFEVRTLHKRPNFEKQRVKDLHTQSMDMGHGKTAIVVQPKGDSAAYYNSVMRQPNTFDSVGKDVLPGDSIAFALDSVTAGLYFRDYLMVIYKHGTAPPEYRNQLPDPGPAMNSQLRLLSEAPVEVHANGNYFDPANLLASGFWSWSEKIATMLPFDYKPKK
ncbi:MAG TPA: carboxypeptidase-like regulatory domain-containing protein [Flavisolibacter sp.]|jgi:hypothetical protein